MKKKIITLALAVVMCLSVITSVTAANNLNRVASTIPGTDIEYNYVENVTVQIPGTEVTFDFEGVADFVLVNQKYTFNLMEQDPESGEWVSTPHSYDIPVYHFSIFEQSGRVTINQDGEWLAFRGCAMIGDGHTELLSKGQILQSSSAKMTRDVGADVYDEYSTIVDANGLCCGPTEIDSIASPIAMIEIQIVDHRYFEKESFDKEKFDVNYYYGFNNWEEKIDITEFAIYEKYSYSIIEGANSVVNSNENALTIKVDGDFDKFTGVKVDSELVDSSNYTATEGSTIIEFNADYLKTLNAGEHTVSVVFIDGEATTKFEIKEDKNTNTTDKNESNNNLVTDVEIPNTDYNTSVAPVFVAIAFSGVALVGLKKKSK